MVTFGNASGKIPEVDIFKLTPNVVKLMRPSLFEFLKTEQDMKDLTAPLLDLIRQNKLHFKIHHVYDLKDAGQAHEDLEGNSLFIKVYV